MPNPRVGPSTAVEALPLAVVIVDENGSVALANPRAVELLAVREGDDAPAFLRDLAVRAAVTAEEIRATIDAPLASGASIAIEIRATPVDGGVVYAIDALTERARRERADRDFITNAAHQLRTPITAIATAVEVLQSGAKNTPEARDRFLGHIERQTERLVRLARAMLTLSRAERGDLGPLLGLVPLRPLLEALVEELPRRRRVKIVLECPPEATALADDALLTEALANLVGNAVDHTNAGSVTIAVGETTGGMTAIDVIDTGAGIAADELARVFERFHRGTKGGDGAGLGLPIAKAAIEALGGTLELTSALGVGTTARILLRRS